MLSLRLAHIDDSASLNSVSADLGYDGLSDDEASRCLQNILNSKTDFVYVAESGGSIVGWIHVFYANRLASKGFYEIGGLVVSKNHRRDGIGKALVEYARQQHPGVWRVRCNSARSDAHGFYENIGFQKSKTQYVFENTG